MSHIFTVEITDEEYKAFSIRVVDPDGWVDHAVREKVRRSMEYVIEETIKNSSLDPADATSISNTIAARGEVLKNTKDYSDEIKQAIVGASKMDTAVVAREKEANNRTQLFKNK